MERQPNTQYVVSISHGKDSLAMLEEKLKISCWESRNGDGDYETNLFEMAAKVDEED